MITAACKDELPNPHKNCLHEILNTLVVRFNDFRRMNSEMRNLRAEFKAEMRTMEFPCHDLRRLLCCTQYSKGDGENFLTHVGRVNEMYTCFTRRIDELEAKIQAVVRNACDCLLALNSEKMQMKRFHERTVDHLKRTAIMSNDAKVIANCERDICELQRLFAKEVASIKKVESELQPFFEQLRIACAADGVECPQLQQPCAQQPQQFANVDCLQQYEWLPAAKNLSTTDSIGEAIKSQMGSTLVKAFAQAHIHQAADVKGFLATYLLNLERNDKVLQEKIQLLGENAETVTCEVVL